MIYLFLVCLCVNLISAHPLANLLLQSRPNCNQNGYNSYNLPMQANNQPYTPPSLIQNPITTCPNNQAFGPQNGLPVQIKVDDTNQSYLNKILANPMLQNILNRNNNNFNQNNKDIALQANPGQTPNIINNYYIIPPECLQGKDDAFDIVKNLIGSQPVVCKNDECPNEKNMKDERKNVQTSQNRQHEEKRQQNGNKRPHNQENGSVRNQNNNNIQKRKRKNGHQSQNQRINNQANQHSNKQDKKINRNINNKNYEPVRIKDERNIPRKRNGTEESRPRNNGNKKRKRPKNKSENENIGDVQQTSNATISSKNDTMLNVVEKESNKKEKKKQTNISVNNKNEDIIRDIHEKFPGIPEDVIRRLLRYLRRQLQNQLSDSNINCDTIQNTNRHSKRHRNNRLNQNKRKRLKSGSDLVHVTEPALSVTTDNSLITSTMIETKDRLNNQVEYNTKYNNEQEHTTEQKIEVVETTTNINLPTQNKILDSENDVDDYFPDFRFDKMYMSEDDYIRSLRDNRFYYTTDRSHDLEKGNKNVESSEIYYEPFERTGSKKVTNYEFQSHEIEDTLRRPDKNFGVNYDEVVWKDYSGEEIEFQTPPILEYPDFETKPILKYFDVEGPIYIKPDHKNLDNVNDKLSTYSDVKSVNTPLKTKPISDNIETVFARSKVAKYGQPEKFKEDTSDKKENSKYDDTVVVYAKSFTDS